MQICACSRSRFFSSRMGACVLGAPPSSAVPAGPSAPNSRRTNSNTRSWVTFPAAVMTRWSGANQLRKREQSASRLNFLTVSGVPRIGRPSECPGQKPRVKISWRRYSGLSRSILISSRTTLRSFFTSSESNFGRRTRSAITSKAMGRCSSSTLALKQICSLEVKASSMPPTESISRAMASAERRSVPLKTMCSMKWAKPFSSGISRREPLRTHTPTETERTWDMVSVMTTRPLGKTCFWISRVSVAIIRLCHRPGGKEKRKLNQSTISRWIRRVKCSVEIFAVRRPRLQEFFRGVQLAVFAGVVERDVAVSAFFAKINLATVEGPGVHMNADGALVEFREIQNLMHGFERVDVGRMRGVHFVDVGRNNAASSERAIAPVNAEILDFKAADGRGHPAILIAMVVNAAVLADLPANGHAFEDFVLEDEIAGVVAFRKIAVILERLGAHGMPENVVLDILQREFALGDCGETMHPIGDSALLRCYVLRHGKPPIRARPQCGQQSN